MKKIFITVIFFGLSVGLTAQAQAATGNSSVSAKKQDNGYYTITIKDPQGLKSFALKSPGNLPYSGDLNECPRVFVVDNVSPAVINDFSGEVNADIIDCQNNDDELKIPEIGDKKSVTGKREEPPAPAVKPVESAVSVVSSETAPTVNESAIAGEPVKITYPVKELGGCADKDTCKVYCEEPGNMGACVNFSEKHNLISKKEANDGRKFSGIVNSRGGGPGGCKTRESCEAYCENSDNIDSCLAFAENSDLVDKKDLDEMRKVSKLLKEGAEFPGGCKSKSQCEAYCAKPDNMDVCLAFAEKAGFIPKEELEMAKKVVPLMKAGKTPGGCRSKEACDTYCEDPDHLDACVAFGEQMGAIKPEEVAMIKKTGGKGPGDCRGKKQCDAFCQISENQETCFNFGKDNGLIPPEDLKKMEEGMKFITEALNDESSDLGQCLSTALGPNNVARAKAGKPIIDRSVETKLKGCFEQFPPKGMGPGGPGGQGGQGGPGGCKSQEECQAYCQDHQEECQSFQPSGGGGPGDQGGQNQFQNELICSPKGTAASFVCGKNGRNANSGGPETTYFNACTAKQDGAEIIHEGVCEGHNPCGDVADPVCGNDGNTWVSSCYAIESGGGVKYEGACKGQSNQGGQPGQNQPGQSRQSGGFGGPNQGQGFNPGSGRNSNGGGGGQGGPGGCKGPEECQKYCDSNPEVCKNFQPRQRQQSRQQPQQQSGGGFQGGQNQNYQQQNQQQFQQQYQQGGSSSGFGPSPEDMQKIQQQFQQQYQQQIPQQYQQQMEGQNQNQQYQNFQPSSGSYGPPPGGMQPPADMQQQINFQPPPGM